MMTIFSPHAAPSAVLNVDLFESVGGLSVTWDEPEEPNGVLQYNVTLTQTNLANPDTPLDVLTNITMETNFSFSLSLPPYYEYNVTVTPFTGGGKGGMGFDTHQTNEAGETVERVVN